MSIPRLSVWFSAARLAAVGLAALPLWARFPQPAEANGVPHACRWSYYSHGLPPAVPLFEDPDETVPADLRFGRFFSESPFISGTIDFDGDGKTDPFRLAHRDDNLYQWQYWSVTLGGWQDLAFDGQSLERLRFGDFDLDGLTDIFTAIDESGDFQWKISSGGDTGYVDVNSSDFFPFPAAIGDFDGDAVADVFAADFDGVSLYNWFLSSGASEPYELTGASIHDPFTLRFGDFDGDAKTDVFAVTNQGDGNFQWMYFSAAALPPINLALTPYPVGDLNFGDFNDDGITDVFVAVDQPNASSRWEYWPGGLGEPVELQTLTAPPPFLGDFDGDTSPDAAVAECAEAPLFTRTPHDDLFVLQADAVYRLFVADIDADGADDLLWNSRCQVEGGAGFACTTNHNLIGAGLSEHNGRFDEEFVDPSSQTLDDQINWNDFKSFVGDVNADGRADLIFANPDFEGDNIIYTAVSEPAAFTLSQAINLGQAIPGYNISPGDFDGDGKTDLVYTTVCPALDPVECSHGATNSVYVAFSTGASFALSSLVDLGGINSEFFVLAGDVDGDGDDDLIFNSTCQGGVGGCSLFENNVYTAISNGNGGFTLGSLQAYGGGWINVYRYPFSADFNGDGKSDLLWYSPCPPGGGCDAVANEIRIGLANGDGTFLVSDARSLGVRNWVNFDLLPGDLDGDGSDDLAFVQASDTNDTRSAFVLPAISQGDGTFTVSPLEVVRGRIGGVSPQPALGDFDANGKADVIWHQRDDVDVLMNDFSTTTTTTSTTSTTLGAAPCGDDVITPPEECDDGDPSWVPGEFCNGTCEVVVCGDPDDSGITTASDALFVLRTSVGTNTCDTCICDVDANGSVSAADALRLLRRAVGAAVTIICFFCDVPDVTTTTTVLD